jgi:hypothetical protein
MFIPVNKLIKLKKSEKSKKVNLHSHLKAKIHIKIYKSSGKYNKIAG